MKHTSIPAAVIAAVFLLPGPAGADGFGRLKGLLKSAQDTVSGVADSATDAIDKVSDIVDGLQGKRDVAAKDGEAGTDSDAAGISSPAGKTTQEGDFVGNEGGPAPAAGVGALFFAKDSGAFSLGKPEAAAPSGAATQGGAVSKGEALDASLFTGRKRAANAEKFFAERFKGFPDGLVEGVMLTKMDGANTVPQIEYDDKDHVFANVGVRVNMENYAKWTQALQELLGEICLEKETVKLPFKEDTRSRQKPFLRSGEVPLKNVPNSCPVIVATPVAKELKLTAWPATVYYLDSQMFTAFSRRLATFKDLSGHVEVFFKDKDGDPICSKWANFGEDAYSSKISDGFPMCAEFGSNNDGPYSSDYVLITPVLDHDFFMQSLSFSYDRELDPVLALRIDLGKVEEDDLATLAGYEIKVEYRKGR